MEGIKPEVHEKTTGNLDKNHFYYQTLEYRNNDFDARLKIKIDCISFSIKKVKC